MRWLWLISVGVTDVQFPVWMQDEYGIWQGPRRFQLARGGVRKTHEGLLNLLRRERICFDQAPLPPLVERELADRLSFEFEQDPASDEFLAALHPSNYRLSGRGEFIPNADEDRLLVYCPKVAPLADKAREIFGGDSVTVLVLNTRRAEAFGSEARDEPIASGPLVARYLAEHLDLDWRDSDGRLPRPLGSGVSTWIDLLTGHEAMEDPDAQTQVVARLNEALRAWSGGGQGEQRVLVTISGGMPPLKPLIERLPAIHFGQQHVTLLDQPERGGRGVTVTATPLSYGERVTEREMLRFHCAEALRAGDYAGAYGLAHRAGHRPWADAVCNRLGPLLELPGHPFQLKGGTAEPFILHACQVETRLCMGDVAGALLRMGPFIESVAWKLIAEDVRIRALGVRIDRANECLLGVIPWDHALFASQIQYFRPNPEGTDQHRVNALTWEWPKWLAEPEGGQREAAQALIQVCVPYNSDQRGTSPRQYRNLLAHGSDQTVGLQEIARCMKERGLIAATGRRFGENFTTSERVAKLLDEMGAGDLQETLSAYLADVRQRVIEG